LSLKKLRNLTVPLAGVICVFDVIHRKPGRIELAGEQKPGRSAFLQALASAVTRERLPANIHPLLDLAANQDAAQAWRQQGLLSGLAANASGRARDRIPLDREPAALRVLARSIDPHTRERVGQIQGMFSWPGHPSDTAPQARTPDRKLTASEKSIIAEGRELYQQVCAGCHGVHGEGVRPVAPPLDNSEWVTESAD
jgi:cytochrome c553